MGVEIEKKFLVQSDTWKEGIKDSIPMKQGYLEQGNKVSVRVRVEGEQSFLNIKSMDMGMKRLEYEYPIPLQDADEILAKLCTGPLITKTRYLVSYEGLCWEVDVFKGDNDGLVVAELEMESVDQNIPIPPWVGTEVTDYIRYYNISLVHYPYAQWTAEEKAGV